MTNEETKAMCNNCKYNKLLYIMCSICDGELMFEEREE